MNNDDTDIEITDDDIISDSSPHPWDLLMGKSEDPRLKRLTDRREVALLQVAMAAREVSVDSGSTRTGATHYLVDKYIMDTLTLALQQYNDVNEEYLIVISGLEATPSTKGL